MDKKTDLGIPEDAIFAMAEIHRDAALLHFAHRAGLFDFLTIPRSTGDVASTFNWVERKVDVLLNALCALGLTLKQDQRYEVTSNVRKRLVLGSAHYIGSYVEVLRRQWDVWKSLPEIMSQDSHVIGQQLLGSVDNDGFTALFQDAMSQVCDGNIRGLSDLEIWKQGMLVIDLGGGHGLHVATLCKEFPGMRGEVWDLNSARQGAEQNFQRHGVTDQASFRVCDLDIDLYASDTLADAVMLNHVLHHFNPDQAERILVKAVAMLEPRGSLIVIDQTLQADGYTPHDSALFSFYLMVNNSKGQLHSVPWISQILERCGCSVRLETCGWNNEDFILIATRT
ncbi:TPA: methyltransferase domain-containing protein [Pseudomonas aeruginosa]|jgi:2-polyprenyl-3-methyl-5-hydroxy-6-metoxy-1,4-benzoquinol methylase|uniref:methyltransferase n=1 Tax=Citrobacter freundii TaxID=546 RepID=UPI00177B8DFE|nr:methyltransferase [Citrobacter freundii]MBD5678307.1 methyltransferase domain-containing protein [Citrobacter freundii]HCF1493395.1 methyltransferase domain-containing protein [Pseudomonas aeruginosa]HEK1521090.1 methyltransferase domain-containing protein [Pseudomonas aeruginosa]HEK1547252.1 methyltransferase domain-containing protein [Pseudomonas aeruginosa]